MSEFQVEPNFTRGLNLENGKRVILSSLERKDLMDLIGLYNSLVAEDIDILQDKQITVDEGAALMEDMLDRMRRGRALALVAEVDGKVVANATVVWKSGLMSHVGEVGVTIHKDYRNRGIGMKMVETLVQLSKERGLKMLQTSIFRTNAISRLLFSNLGFQEIAMIPKMFHKKGSYIDEVLTVLELK
ncbi:MAG: GNAT family N-acetyltransferase [Candidatus Bathyarchaeota archaeon]